MNIYQIRLLFLFVGYVKLYLSYFKLYLEKDRKFGIFYNFNFTIFNFPYLL